MAVARIRRSAGRIYGLSLAVFDGLLFPMLALDYAIARNIKSFGIGYLGWTQSFDPVQNARLTVTSLLAWAVADFVIVRAVWRAIHKPLTAPPADPPLAPDGPSSSDSLWSTLALVAAGLSWVLTGAAFYRLPHPPAMLVELILLSALLGGVLGFVARHSVGGKVALAMTGVEILIFLAFA